MNPLEQAIKESKEREEKATKGPWEACNGVLRAPQLELESMQKLSEFANISGLEDSRFVARARTWEPKWREMVELSVSVIQEAADVRGKDSWAHKALAELTRLAKDALEESGADAKRPEGLEEK